MKIKVCGMREADNIRAVDALGVDYMGFIFYPRSSRYISEIPSFMPERAKRVGGICGCIDSRHHRPYLQLWP